MLAGSREIPFLFYRFLSYLTLIGLKPYAIFFIGGLLVLPITLYVTWYVSYELSQDREVASVATLTFGILTPTTGTLMYTAFPYLNFVSFAACMPFVSLMLLYLLRGRSHILLVIAAVIFAIHPGLGLISYAIAFGNIVIFFEKSQIRRLLVCGVISAGIAMPILLCLLPSESGSSEEFFFFIPRISVHTYIEKFWPDQFLKTICLTALFFLVSFPEAKEQHKRAKVTVLLACLLFAIYVVGLYVIESRVLVRMYLWRASVYLKPLILTVLISALASTLIQCRKPKLKIAGVILAILGLATDNWMHSYYGGILLFWGLTLMGESTRMKVLSSVWALYLIYLSQLDQWDPVYIAGVVVAPVILYFSINNYKIVRCGGSPGIAVLLVGFIIVSGICCGQPAGSAQFFPSFPPLPFHQNLADEETLLLEWARENTPKQSMFILHPQRRFSAQFRALAERSIYLHNDDIQQLSYASGKTQRAAYRRGEELGLAMVPKNIFQRHYSMEYSDWECRSLKIARSTPWIDFLIYSSEEDPINQVEHAIYSNGSYRVYESKMLISIPAGVELRRGSSVCVL